MLLIKLWSYKLWPLNFIAMSWWYKRAYTGVWRHRREGKTIHQHQQRHEWCFWADNWFWLEKQSSDYWFAFEKTWMCSLYQKTFKQVNDWTPSVADLLEAEIHLRSWLRYFIELTRRNMYYSLSSHELWCLSASCKRLTKTQTRRSSDVRENAPPVHKPCEK